MRRYENNIQDSTIQSKRKSHNITTTNNTTNSSNVLTEITKIQTEIKNNLATKEASITSSTSLRLTSITKSRSTTAILFI